MSEGADPDLLSRLPSELTRSYSPVRLLGAGTFGLVFLAYQLRLKRQVVVKVLRRLDARDRARFEREARALARIEHPAVAKLVDYGSDAELAFLVYLHAPGESLRAVLDDRERLAWPEVVQLGRDLAHGLAAAHAAGIVHRDVKPANLLVTEAGSLMLLDFGLVLDLGAERLTTAQGTVGTPAYLSPEALMGRDVGPASDLFAMGLTLYELIVGRRPFDASDLSALIRQHINDRVVAVPAVQPAVPPALESLILEMLEKQPADRPTAADAAARLEALLPQAPGEAARVRVAPGEAGPARPVERDVAEMRTAATMSLVAPAVPRERPRSAAMVHAALLTGAVLLAVIAGARTAPTPPVPPAEGRPSPLAVPLADLVAAALRRAQDGSKVASVDRVMIETDRTPPSQREEHLAELLARHPCGQALRILAPHLLEVSISRAAQHGVSAEQALGIVSLASEVARVDFFARWRGIRAPPLARLAAGLPGVRDLGPQAGAVARTVVTSQDALLSCGIPGPMEGMFDKVEYTAPVPPHSAAQCLLFELDVRKVTFPHSVARVTVEGLAASGPAHPIQTTRVFLHPEVPDEERVATLELHPDFLACARVLVRLTVEYVPGDIAMGKMFLGPAALLVVPAR